MANWERFPARRFAQERGDGLHLPQNLVDNVVSRWFKLISKILGRLCGSKLVHRSVL